MSNNWDKQHAENKGAAKDAFEKAAEETDRGHDERMKIALDGVSDFEEKPASYPGSVLDDSPAKFNRQQGMDPNDSQTDQIAQEGEQEDLERKPPEQERPAPPPPALSMGANSRLSDDMRRQNEARMRALLEQQKSQEKSRERGD